MLNAAEYGHIEFNRPWLYPKQRQAIFDAVDCNGNPARFACIEASTKSGKAQPLDALIYTPCGPKRMGDVVVGDRVLTATGTASIIGVFNQGMRPIYRVEFSDGSVVEADEDHLWETQYFRQKPKVLTTKQLMMLPDWKFRRTWVPSIAAAQFDESPTPVDPYLLGLLIGDGCLGGTSTGFSSADDELIDYVRKAIPKDHDLKKSGDGYDWRITAGNKNAAQLREDGRHFRSALRELGVLCHSHNKFIPAVYRYNSEAVRRSVLQGILDTDGFVDRRGQPSIEQTSKLLAEHITELVQSLGGTVLTRLRKVAGYRDKQGNFKQCRPVYRQAIRFSDARWCFRLKRKAEKVRPKSKTGNRMLKSITFSRQAEARCIEIDCPRHLYLTDGFIPTHNTTACIAWLVEQAIQGGDGDNYWWIAPIFPQAKIAYRRMKRALPKELYRSNEQEMFIELVTGGTIWFKGADRPDSLYGEDVRAVVVDEASRVKEEAWHAIRSVVTFTRGPIRCIGNVKGRKNWFYRLARTAEAGAPGMSFSKLTAYDAVAGGVLESAEIEDAKRLLPEAVFKELYLAEASDDEGNPFGYKHIEACLRPISEDVTQVCGVDLAKSLDWTVVMGLDRAMQCTGFDRWQKVPWPETEARILDLVGLNPTLVDSTGVGSPVIDALQKARVGVFEGYHFTPASKQALMEGLVVAIQNHEVGFPDGPIRAELDLFEYKYTRTGVIYTAPAGYHDDCVVALALAVAMYRRKFPTMAGVSPADMERVSPWLGGPTSMSRQADQDEIDGDYYED